jgi:hypothetical protein
MDEVDAEPLARLLGRIQASTAMLLPVLAPLLVAYLAEFVRRGFYCKLASRGASVRAIHLRAITGQPLCTQRNSGRGHRLDLYQSLDGRDPLVWPVRAARASGTGTPPETQERVP